MQVWKKLLTLGLLSFSALTQGSTILTFTDRTDFLNATATTAIDIPSFGGGTVTIGSVVFSGGPSATLLFSNGFSSLLGNELVFSGNENFNVDIASGIFSFGFDTHEPTKGGPVDGCNTGRCVDSTFEFSIFGNAGIIDSFTFLPADDLLSFAGITSDILFTRVQIREIVGSIDNEFFGNFVQGSSPLNTTPLPASIWLFGLGLFGLSYFRKEVG